MKNYVTKLALRALAAREAIRQGAKKALLECDGAHVIVEDGGLTGFGIAIIVVIAVFGTGFVVNQFDPQLGTSLMNILTGNN